LKDGESVDDALVRALAGRGRNYCGNSEAIARSGGGARCIEGFKAHTAG